MPEPTKAFTAREACTVLASLRTFQIIRNCERPGFRKDVTFDASLMKEGKNVLKLTIPAGGLTSGIIYDYLRLEVDDK